MKLDKPTQAAIIAAKINHLSDYVDKNFDESKVIGEGKMAEMSYKDKFAKALKDSGKSLADMSDDEKKKFFNKVDSMHSAKNEEVELDEMKHEMAHEMMKKEMMKKMEMAMKNEGFASDAQRKAAFASGYKEKGKDKKEMMKMNAMKMPIRAMYKKEMKTGDDDMSPMNNMKLNAMVKEPHKPHKGNPIDDMNAGYMKLNNTSDTDITLHYITSPVYDAVQIHSTTQKNGVAKMVHAKNLVIPAKGSVALEPGGSHLMLMGPRRNIKEGDEILAIAFGDHEKRYMLKFLVVDPRKQSAQDTQHQHHNH